MVLARSHSEASCFPKFQDLYSFSDDAEYGCKARYSGSEAAGVTNGRNLAIYALHLSRDGKSDTFKFNTFCLIG